MYSIRNRDDLEKLKKLNERKDLLKENRMKEKLGKQDFHYDMEKVFKPVTENQNQNQIKQEELSEKQIQAIKDSDKATTQAIENQTKAIQESSNAFNKNLQKSIEKGIQEYDEISEKNREMLTNLVNSNQVDSSIIKRLPIS